MVWENRRSILKGIAGTGAAAGLGSAIASAGEDNSDSSSDDVSVQQTEARVDWEGQGSENAELTCPEQAYWHWILTSGGNVQIQSGTLHVTYENGDTDAVQAYFPGAAGRGAAHFDVIADSDGDSREIVDAHVEYTYTGEVSGNVVLTISHSNCVDAPPQEPPGNGDGNGDGPDKKECKKYHAKELAFHRARKKYFKEQLIHHKRKVKYHKKMHKKGKCEPDFGDDND